SDLPGATGIGGAVDAQHGPNGLPPVNASQPFGDGTGGIIRSQTSVPSGTVAFVANSGQADPQAQFLGHAPGFGFSLSTTGITFNLGSGSDTVHMQLVGADPATQLVGVNPVADTAATPFSPAAKFDAAAYSSAAAAAFSRVEYRDVLPGI